MEHDVLPFFCFPTGVNVRVSGAARSSNDGVTAAANTANEFTFPDNDAAPAAYPSAIGNSRCFAFLLNNNANPQQVLQTSTQTHKFGVCLLVQRSFRDHARGIIVTCEYCICLVSALPFLGFLFHILIQFEATGGLELNAPVRAFESTDDNELFRPPELRMLSEFARRLRSVHVPLFPGARMPADAAGGSPSPDAAPEMTFAALKFAMVVRTGGATPRSSANAALAPGAGQMPNMSPSTGSAATRLRSPSIVATAMSAANMSQPASRLPPCYVASTATGVIKLTTKLMKKNVVGTFRRDLMAPFCSLPAAQRDPNASHATLIPIRPPSPPRSPPRSQYAARAAYCLARALSTGANLTSKRVRRMLPLLEEEREKEACFHTLLWALPVLLRHLTLDQIISVVGWAMTEMRVVVVGKDLAVVSGIVLALINLLRPLKWAGPVIVSLPASLHAFVESPVPLILGMQALPEGFQLQQGILVIDADEPNKDCTIKLDKTDVVVSHTRRPPKANDLKRELAAPGEMILRYSRTRRRTRSGATSISPATVGRPTSPMTTRSVSPYDRTGTDGAALQAPLAADDLFEPPTVILPNELDAAEGSKGQKLMQAVCAFSAAMAAHVEMTVKTAMHMHYEEKKGQRKGKQPTAGPATALKRYSLDAYSSSAIVRGVSRTAKRLSPDRRPQLQRSNSVRADSRHGGLHAWKDNPLNVSTLSSKSFPDADDKAGPSHSPSSPTHDSPVDMPHRRRTNSRSSRNGDHQRTVARAHSSQDVRLSSMLSPAPLAGTPHPPGQNSNRRSIRILSMCTLVLIVALKVPRWPLGGGLQYLRRRPCGTALRRGPAATA